MQTGHRENLAAGRGYRAGTIMIGVTACACLAALVFRTPLRSCYWAWQAVRGHSLEERLEPLTNLCEAGDAGRWGTEALLAHSDEEIRQFGVFVLQHIPSEWSRHRLSQMLADSSESVREMAVLGLAMHGDASVVPELKRLCVVGDAPSASAACLALQRLGSPEAVAALCELAVQPADVTRRAALVDALEAVGSADCAAALLDLLDDHRRCDVPTRAEQVLARLASVAAASGILDVPEAGPASQASVQPAPRTIAERAAAALGRITGQQPPFASDMPEEQRNEAAALWREWVTAHGAGRSLEPSPRSLSPGEGAG